MNNKKIILILFILVALMQLYVPAKMILDREDILATGKEFKFKTMPIDPNDPFRGKYIILRFDNNEYTLKEDDNKEWKRDETIFAILNVDSEGFAFVNSIKKTKPTNEQDFFKTKVKYVYGDNNIFSNKVVKNTKKVAIDFPFNRFYMEETKAYDAELAYIEMESREKKPTYALVNIKNGNAVLKDVIINDTSVVEIVRRRQNK